MLRVHGDIGDGIDDRSIIRNSVYSQFGGASGCPANSIA
jgi:hypothetical protein